VQSGYMLKLVQSIVAVMQFHSVGNVLFSKTFKHLVNSFLNRFVKELK